MSGDRPTVSVVVPALNEADYLPATLSALAGQTHSDSEVLVVDGGSDDRTPSIVRQFGVPLIEQEAGGIGRGRDLGAQAAAGEWLAFVDADTVVTRNYLDRMLETVRSRDLAAASSRCRVAGSLRGKPMEWSINYLFPRLGRPILPGFNTFVSRDAYDAVGGYPDVPNEDTAFSRQLADRFDVGYCPAVLVETSGRRFASSGLLGGTWHYLSLDFGRWRADY